MARRHTVYRRLILASGIGHRRNRRPEVRAWRRIGRVRARRTLAACLPPSPTTRTALVRRARKIDRVLAETYPDARCELDFDNPFELLVVTVLCAQTTDKRVNAVRPTLFAAYPDAPSMAAAERADLEQIIGPLGFFRAKTESLLKLQPALVDRFDGEVPPRLDDLVTLPGRRPQDRQRRARQRLRRPRHHRRHPLRPAGPPVRLDRGDRPGQGRARGRRAVPQARLDDAQPPPDLARPPRCHARKPACGACPVARWCPAYGEGPTDPESPRPSWSRPRAAHEACPRGRARRPCCSCCRLLRRRRRPTRPGPGPAKIDVDTPELRQMKQAAGIEDCAPGDGDAGGRRPARRHAALPRRRARRRPGRARAARWWSTCGRRGAGRAARRCRSSSSSTSSTAIGCRCSASTTRTRRPSRPSSWSQKTGVTYPLLADPQGDAPGQDPFPADGPADLRVRRRGRHGRRTASTAGSTSVDELVDLVDEHLGADL